MQTAALKEMADGGLISAWATPAWKYSEAMLGPVMTMMRRGVLIDTTERDVCVRELQARSAKIRTTFDTICEALFGTDININSTPQLYGLFYKFLGIPEQTKSKKGEVKVATDREILERIANSYPRGAVFANLILRLRDLEKQVEFLSKKLTKDNRLLYSYNIAGTETFRFSSSEHPLRMGANAQQIPPIARRCCVPDPGYVMFQADQQGAEARLVAYLSGDPNYIAAVEGGDSHTMVASMVFGFEPKRELAEREYFRGKSYRQVCKALSHGSNFQGKPFTLSRQAGVEASVIEQFQFNYFKKFPGIQAWHLWIANQIQTRGYMVNVFGFRRTFWGRKWDDATLREATAFGPQSAVGVLTNLAIHALWNKYEGQPGAPLQILMNTHDGVVGQIREDLVEILVPELLETLKIPFPVADIHGTVREVVIPFDLELGHSWDKKSDVNPSGLVKWKQKT